MEINHFHWLVVLLRTYPGNVYHMTTPLCEYLSWLLTVEVKRVKLWIC